MKRMLAKNCHDQFGARAVLIHSFCIYSAKIIPIFFIDTVCFVQYNSYESGRNGIFIDKSILSSVQFDLSYKIWQLQLQLNRIFSIAK